MFTFDEAQNLLKLPKKVESNGKLLEKMNLDQSLPFQKRFALLASDEPDFFFLYDASQSKKNNFKLSLYIMENESKIGLLRVDFSGQHQNPEIITDNVPAVFHPYAGKFFSYDDHHIHYYVEGYRSTLDWALPLTADSFPIKQIKDASDIVNAFRSFNEVIHLETEFSIAGSLF